MKANVLKLVCIWLWQKLLTEKDIRKSVCTGKKQLGKRLSTLLNLLNFSAKLLQTAKENLEMSVEAENGATAGKFDLAKRAKAANLDAIHDTVHEMARDEARHGKAFEGLLRDISANLYLIYLSIISDIPRGVSKLADASFSQTGGFFMSKYTGTKTEQNLINAFAGESQARNKYTYYASAEQKPVLYKWQIFLKKLQIKRRNMPKCGLRNSTESIL